MIAHNVYFTLRDDSAESRSEFASSCAEYLGRIPGIVFFATGTRAEEFQREVNDLEFHVGLHVMLRDRAAHDVYQEHERHLAFIEANQGKWAAVRVFDSEVEGSEAAGSEAAGGSCG